MGSSTGAGGNGDDGGGSARGSGSGSGGGASRDDPSAGMSLRYRAMDIWTPSARTNNEMDVAPFQTGLGRSIDSPPPSSSTVAVDWVHRLGPVPLFGAVDAAGWQRPRTAWDAFGESQSDDDASPGAESGRQDVESSQREHEGNYERTGTGARAGAGRTEKASDRGKDKGSGAAGTGTGLGAGSGSPLAGSGGPASSGASSAASFDCERAAVAAEMSAARIVSDVANSHATRVSGCDAASASVQAQAQRDRGIAIGGTGTGAGAGSSLGPGDMSGEGQRDREGELGIGSRQPAGNASHGGDSAHPSAATVTGATTAAD